MSLIGALGPTGWLRDLRSSVLGALHVRTPGLQYLGQESLAVSTSSVGLASIPGGATIAAIQVTNNSIFWTHTPSLTPSTTVGKEAYPQDEIWLEGQSQLTGFRALQNAGAAVLQIHYYKEGDYDE